MQGTQGLCGSHMRAWASKKWPNGWDVQYVSLCWTVQLWQKWPR